MNKRCCTCKQTKSVDAFNRCRSNPDGLQLRCRVCAHTYLLSRPVVLVSEKQCSRCLTIKEASHFARIRLSKDGLHCYCRDCSKIIKNNKAGRFFELTLSKPCRTCSEVKSLVHFNKEASGRFGRSAHCKICLRAKFGHREHSPPIVNGRRRCKSCGLVKHISLFYKRKYLKKGYHCSCKRCDRVNVELRGGASARHRKTRYGLTSEQYTKMINQQGGHCGLCGGPPGIQGLVVDHDHKTGTVRALLCATCNWGIGHFRENPSICELAAAYLRRHASTKVEITIPDGVGEPS